MRSEFQELLFLVSEKNKLMRDINLENFRFSTPVYIRWNDLDPIGHVNNVYYFDYFQNGRSFYMPAASPHWDWRKNMFVIAHIECDYFAELGIEDTNPEIKIRTTKIGTKSFDFEYLITSKKEDKAILHCLGKSTQVLIDLSTKKSIEIPDWLKKDIESYEPAFNK